MSLKDFPPATLPLTSAPSFLDGFHLVRKIVYQAFPLERPHPERIDRHSAGGGFSKTVSTSASHWSRGCLGHGFLLQFVDVEQGPHSTAFHPSVLIHAEGESERTSGPRSHRRWCLTNPRMYAAKPCPIWRSPWRCRRVLGLSAHLLDNHPWAVCRRYLREGLGKRFGQVRNKPNRARAPIPEGQP